MKINILFNINKLKSNSKGLCVIMCRLTYNKVRKSFSTRISINPSLWNSKQQSVKPPEPDSELINTQLNRKNTKLWSLIMLGFIQQKT